MPKKNSKKRSRKEIEKAADVAAIIRGDCPLCQWSGRRSPKFLLDHLRLHPHWTSVEKGFGAKPGITQENWKTVQEKRIRQLEDNQDFWNGLSRKEKQDAMARADPTTSANTVAERRDQRVRDDPTTSANTYSELLNQRVRDDAATSAKNVHQLRNLKIAKDPTTPAKNVYQKMSLEIAQDPTTPAKNVYQKMSLRVRSKGRHF